jgi:Stigma-specific protein, Stig1
VNRTDRIKNCELGLTQCGDKCINTNLDSNNCGLCSHHCKEDEVRFSIRLCF